MLYLYIMIIFFGFHCNIWSLALNINNLYQFFHCNIINTTSIDEVKKYKNAIIIPLLEKHTIELHSNNVNCILDYTNTILFIKNYFLNTQ